MVETAERIFEGEEEDEAEEIGPQQRRIISESQGPSIFDLHRRYQRNRLVLQPRFQRRPVWDVKKQSRFVESILLDVPLPLIFLGEENDGTQVVIDGQQRLRAAFEFFNNGFVLTGLQTMTELQGKAFRDLGEIDPQLQDKIENKSLPVVLIKKESHPQIKFDVFQRLNSGAVPLNAQEIRNCIYRGPFNDLLIELSVQPDFQRLLGFTHEDPRMKDVELVLRFLAFYDQGYENYRKSMRSFLDAEMERQGSIADQDIRRLRDVFNQTVRVVGDVFGDKAFRRYEAREEGGRWRTGQNIALYDVVMYGFARRLQQRPGVMSQADSIREALIVLLSHNDEFNQALDVHTSDKDQVNLRFEIWLQELGAILGSRAKRDPRTFSHGLKQAMFEANATCQICSSQILDIDDAEVDHIEQYWRGGRTIPENARLVHRYCNRSRSRQSDS